MNDFLFQLPTRFVFGRGVTDRVGSELAADGYRHALVVYGQGSVVRTGTLARVTATLDAEGIAHTELSGVRPNPEVGLVREGVELARSCGADLVLAVGGGSVIDTAKAIALGVPYEGDVWDLFSGAAKPVAEGKLPVACVLTIPAAGSESSASAVISNDELSLKRGLSSELHRPVIAFMDPELTYTLPAYQTAAGVTDMIAHIMERYFSGVGPVPVTDNIACGIIRSLIEEAPRALANPEDYDARANIMWAGALAHNDIAGLGRNTKPGGRAGGWESHGLEHELSAHHTQITHGAGLAVVFPAWMRYVWHSAPERFLSFGRDVFGIEPVDADADGVEVTPEEAVADAVAATIDELQAFFVSMGMPCTLGELGVTAEDVPALLGTLEQNKGAVFGELQRLTMEDARAIYESCL
ncbi:NADH-dependent alcohol dehydrogenase [Olsenella sp. An285]|uniref:iron-containing alcohol dehydrogenase n=1 Tax=Olsenella sp. An285 TaxID=1965621 RepID=UPI000B3A5C5C|nr:iron-containing alcohol dehydrogenase [Olsenella sp. An285]OUO47533.1 NADH-dependent alcohol dehydrogenase [Olsenella sp. An285]